MAEFLPFSPELLAVGLTARNRRILFLGESGSGKSSLAAILAEILLRTGHSCFCIGADPGSPSFGIPGAVCLGRWRQDGWQTLAMELLCTLDAGRFRLPLVSAVRRLSGWNREEGTLLVDAPGIVRGVGAAELLTGLAEAATPDTVMVLARSDKKIPLEDELAALPCQVIFIQPSARARHPGDRERARSRTLLWDEYLRDAVPRHFPLSQLHLLGTPPPFEAPEEWRGRQIALLQQDQFLAAGEVAGLENGLFHLRVPEFEGHADRLVIRDARRDTKGRLATAKPHGKSAIRYLPPPDASLYPEAKKDTGPRPVVRVGEATAVLLNGVFGDPLLHLRLHNRKRSLLFDLGECERLPARLAHQVTDVCISHAHLDHLSGFLWFLRSRLGSFPPCRLYGPPGLSDHIAGLIAGIHWDRIGDWGPRFEVAELHGDFLVIHGLQAGREGREFLDERGAPGGLLWDDPAVALRAVTLTHEKIPVVAYACSQKQKLNVRQERLAAEKVPAGPWVGDLKKRIAAGDRGCLLRLPDGRRETAGVLAEEFLQITPEQKMVYATDLADTPANREKLIRLAAGAHTLFCEAAFVAEDAGLAERSGHLTTRGCGEISRAAGVERLVPFHFSRRYEEDPLKLYDQIRAAFPRLLLPGAEGL